MKQYNNTLEWISSQQEQLILLLESWVNINSGSENAEGLEHMHTLLRSAFASLEGEMETIALAPRLFVDDQGNVVQKAVGKALRIRKKREGTVRFFLGGHMDTVYGKESPFQKAVQMDNNYLQGPGVADMKGGLVIMLTVLQALERSPFAEKMSWEVVINPDEEVGSTSSAPLFIEGAQRNDVGMIFEPSFDDGAIVSARKGSINFSVVSRGKAAHAGRDFDSGSSAIASLAQFIVAAEQLNDRERGITLNFGRIEGGTATNIVPDLAICRCNARMVDPIELNEIKGKLERIVEEWNTRGASLSLHYETERAPKVFDATQERLFLVHQKAAKELGVPMSWRPSGGVCDGNILVGAGLPTIDTLGAVGGKIHTFDEYIQISSLVERAQLATLLLLKIVEQPDDFSRR